MNGLDNLTGRILSEAKAYAAGVKSESDEKIEKLLLEANAEAEAISAEILADAASERDMLLTRAQNQRALIERNRLLSEKRVVIDRVFESACRQLCEMPREEYVNLLVRLVAKYQTQKAEIILNQRDRDAIGDELMAKIVVNKIKNIDISLIKLSKETGSFMGGLILRQGDVDTNCTAEVLCDTLRHSLEPEIIKILEF